MHIDIHVHPYRHVIFTHICECVCMCTGTAGGEVGLQRAHSERAQYEKPPARTPSRSLLIAVNCAFTPTIDTG